MWMYGIITLKISIKDHFSQSPLAYYWTKHFPDNRVSIKEIYSGNLLLEIKKFTPEDTGKCADLFKRVFSASPWFDDWISINQTRYYLEELIGNPVFEGFVAYENSENIVAVCFGHKKSWWMGKEFIIDEFYVENDKQGNGIGTILLDSIADYLIEDGYKRLILTTNKGIPAEKFYIKNGFHNNQDRRVMIKEI